MCLRKGRSSLFSGSAPGSRNSELVLGCDAPAGDALVSAGAMASSWLAPRSPRSPADCDLARSALVNNNPIRMSLVSAGHANDGGPGMVKKSCPN